MTALGGVNGTVCTAEQYQQSLQSYGSRTPTLSCLTHGDSNGLVLAAEASMLSCICVIAIFIWMGWNIRRYKNTFPDGNWKVFQEPADIYMLSLFVFDLLQGIGGILNIKWAHDGIITTGPYCTAQGLIEQIGELGVALITLFLAVHTFAAAVLPERVGLKARRGIALSLVCLACIFIALWAALGAGIHKNYETPTPYWCWISPQFPGERLAGEYIWLWIALFASALLYSPLYFWAEGYWSIDEEYRLHWRNADERVQYAQRRAALGMLFYPLAYSVIVLPLTVARWLLFTHHHVSSAGTFLAISIFYLSGAVNVALFLMIKTELLRPRQLREFDEPDIQPTPQGDTGPASFSNTNATNFQHSPEPASVVLGDEGPKDSVTPSHVSSRRISDEIDI